MYKLFFILLLLPFCSFGQLTGRVIDDISKEAVVGAKVIPSEGQKVITDFDGKFKLSVSTFPVTIVTSMLPY